jgi:hypothetical protein
MAGEGACDSFRFEEVAPPPTGWLWGAALAGALALLALLAGAVVVVLSDEAQPDQQAATTSRTIKMKLFLIQRLLLSTNKNLSDDTTRSIVHVKLSAEAISPFIIIAACCSSGDLFITERVNGVLTRRAERRVERAERAAQQAYAECDDNPARFYLYVQGGRAHDGEARR